MKEQEKIICEILNNSVRMINHFYEIIYDGRNPTKNDFKYNLESQMREEEIFIDDVPHELQTKEPFLKSILSTKRKVENPIDHLIKLISWNKSHVKSFTDFPEIFSCNARNAEIDEMLHIIPHMTNQLIKNWNTESFEYQINPEYGCCQKFLLINGGVKSVLFEFGNYLH